MGKFQKGHKVGAPSPAKRKKVYSKHPNNLYAHVSQIFISFFFHFRVILKMIKSHMSKYYCKKNLKNNPEISHKDRMFFSRYLKSVI